MILIMKANQMFWILISLLLNIYFVYTQSKVKIYNTLQHKQIQCKSYFGKYSECLVGGPIKFIYFRKQMNRNECKVNQTYGSIQDRGIVWVNKDCSAVFDVYYQTPNHESPFGFIDKFSANADSIQSLLTSPRIPTSQTFSNEYKSATCESAGALNECEFFRNLSSIRLLKQLSFAECSRKRRSYGYVNNRIWVDKGCKATFEVKFKQEEEQYNYLHSLLAGKLLGTYPERRPFDDFMFCASPPATKTYWECPLGVNFGVSPKVENSTFKVLEPYDSDGFATNLYRHYSKNYGRDFRFRNHEKKKNVGNSKMIVVEKFKLLKSIDENKFPCKFNKTYGIDIRSVDPEDEVIYETLMKKVHNPEALPVPIKSASYIWVDKGCAGIFQIRIKIMSSLGFLASDFPYSRYIPQNSKYHYQGRDDLINENERPHSILERQHHQNNIQYTTFSSEIHKLQEILSTTIKSRTTIKGKGIYRDIHKPNIYTSRYIPHRTFTAIAGVYGRWSVLNNTEQYSLVNPINSSITTSLPNTSNYTQLWPHKYLNEVNNLFTLNEFHTIPGVNNEENEHFRTKEPVLLREYVTFCGSGWSEYRECNIGKPIHGIQLQRQMAHDFEPNYKELNYNNDTRIGSETEADSNKCQYQKTFGYRDQNIWVSNGCQAIFTVFLPDYNQTSSPVETDNREETAELACQSLKGRNQCQAPGNITNIALLEEFSKNKCVFGESYGHAYNYVWVDDGCKAGFLVTYLEIFNTFPHSTYNVKRTLYAEPDKNFYSETETAKLPYICNLPLSIGNCIQNLTRYFFDSSKGKCLGFYYTGCNGNANNFLYNDHCERTCRTDSFFPCLLPVEIGNCSHYETKYFFSPITSRCEGFIYSGCSGNANRFSTLEECASLCDVLESVCTLPPDPGNGSSIHIRYFYNPATKRCQQFIYTGDNGNGNKFKSEIECMKRCSSNLAQHGEISIICASYDFTHKECDLGIPVVDLLVEKQLSIFPCKMDSTYGMIGSKVWVFQGCTARFKVKTLGIMPLYNPSFSHFQYEISWKDKNDDSSPNHLHVNDTYNTDTYIQTGNDITTDYYSKNSYKKSSTWPSQPNDVLWYNGIGFNPDPIPTSYELVTCSSSGNDQLQICPLTGSVVKISLYSEISKDVCVEGKTYGRQTSNLWVFNGCQAQFLVWKQ
ncbi:uncharacterized protein LOC135929428 isoform X2 [Gordionus sp. m RMFG-2023]|uniref:uncharacterized protein LOC135929428 isoform X2 n=1 Tax=Gordionus sp. m RMFG-2023 TaxID=3053472 RepID=UPI0031FDCE07